MTALDDIIMPPETLRKRITADGQLWKLAYAEGELAAQPSYDQIARTAAETLWRRQSDVLERRAYTFKDAPSRTTYLAHGGAVADAIHALLNGHTE